MNKRFQFKFPTGTGTSKRVTGKAADAGYTVAKAAQQQAANRQTVRDWWNTGQAKAAQDNSTNKAYTAKLTGGTNIDNSKALVGNLQNTFSGYKDNTKTQTERALQSKLGQGRNWSSPKSAAGNVLMSAAADTTASWLNAAGTALKSNRKSGLAVDSGNS